ncbi:hypothetical protein KIN20_033220 [Parelaphostrongylus tenuis]|uniref:Uncharacterized protein n=1 Tax=Parelaphostrongylus tenuis TaxID=148309 RepID=A0AAD5R894_PARTN|nr:hypothetical protein KIN20_033220 [Parelaphostrongylus tenuis]
MYTTRPTFHTPPQSTPISQGYGTSEYGKILSSGSNSFLNIAVDMTNGMANNGFSSVAIENAITNQRQINSITNYHENVPHSLERVDRGYESTQLHPSFFSLQVYQPTIRASAVSEYGNFVNFDYRCSNWRQVLPDGAQYQYDMTPTNQQHMSHELPPIGMRVQNIYMEDSQQYTESSTECSPPQFS